MEAFEHGMTPFPEIDSCDEVTAHYRPTRGMVRQIFGPAPPNVLNAIHETCSKFDLQPMVLRGRARTPQYVRARHVLMCELYSQHGLTTTQIGKLLNRDHSTVVYALNKYMPGRV